MSIFLGERSVAFPKFPVKAVIKKETLTALELIAWLLFHSQGLLVLSWGWVLVIIVLSCYVLKINFVQQSTVGCLWSVDIEHKLSELRERTISRLYTKSPQNWKSNIVNGIFKVIIIF